MRAGDCKHFTGIQRERCRAGVRYLDVRDTTGPGPYRWPCVDAGLGSGRGPCRTVCRSFVAVTAEEEAADMAKWDRAFAEITAGRCPTCGASEIGLEDGDD